MKKGKSGEPSTARRPIVVWNDDKLAYFKLSGDVWEVNAAGVPGQYQALPKYKQVGLGYSTFPAVF